MYSAAATILPNSTSIEDLEIWNSRVINLFTASKTFVPCDEEQEHLSIRENRENALKFP